MILGWEVAPSLSQKGRYFTQSTAAKRSKWVLAVVVAKASTAGLMRRQAPQYGLKKKTAHTTDLSFGPWSARVR
jgi:hypothetical protein